MQAWKWTIQLASNDDYPWKIRPAFLVNQCFYVPVLEITDKNGEVFFFNPAGNCLVTSYRTVVFSRWRTRQVLLLRVRSDLTTRRVHLKVMKIRLKNRSVKGKLWKKQTNHHLLRKKIQRKTKGKHPNKTWPENATCVVMWSINSNGRFVLQCGHPSKCRFVACIHK